MAETVLISTTDLEPAVRLRDAFEEAGYTVELMTSGEHVGDVPEPGLLVLTGGLRERPAQRLVREAHEHDRLPVLGLADSPAEATPDACRQLGLTEALAKPADIGEVVQVGRRMLERRRLRAVTGIAGESESIREVLERVLQIAPVSSTVLVTGESGTGKELVARGIHALSPRRHQRFIAANVAALPETLLESELFGHEKGAFTGAVAQRKGFFELAHQGTLFLDEIGEMPLATQSKLLRVLEEREFMRVGGEEPIRVDVRVIAATNQELRQLVQAGRFRRDLYYRLNVLSIHLPPLRERREDIPVLVDAFIRSTAAEHDRPPVTIAPDALRLLLEYEWPGNVRELRNLVESMVVLSPGRIVRPQDLPLPVRDNRGGRFLPVHVPQPERADGATSPPELEFVFRTLVGLKMDVEDLRRQFDDFRKTHPELRGVAPGFALPPYGGYPFLTSGPSSGPTPAADDVSGRDVSNVAPASSPAVPMSANAGPVQDGLADDEEPLVVFKAGMTMQDLEREAITAVLKEVHGNRRRAAELLGIGERTLYRKIKEYELPL
jgi:DNA-binding NtrC family response regulator